MYIYELKDWARFHWSADKLAELLASVRHRQGRLIGHMEALGFDLRREAVLQTLTADVLKSSEIEGEQLDAAQVRSSIALRLGMDIGTRKAADRHVEGVVEMMLDATRHYYKPLTAERLFGWNAALFPTGCSGMTKVRTGAWREDSTGPMQVVSSAVGKEHVHFEAPKADRLDAEMRAFMEWFEVGFKIDAVLKAAEAHVWFVTIHPFDDGNGRIARAVADMALGGRNIVRSAFTACRRKSDRSGTTITTSWNRRKRDDGYHALDGVVPRLPWPRHRQGAGNPECRTR